MSGLLETFIKTRPVGEMSGGLEAAASSGAVADVDVDDAAAVLARFENGAVGVFEATRFAKGNRNGNRIEINGSKGSIRWAMDQMNTLELYLENDPLGIQGFRSITCTEGVHPYAGAYWPAGHPIGYEHTFINLMHEFMRGISGNGGNPSPSFEDGYPNQVVLEAIEQSVTAGAKVAITY